MPTYTLQCTDEACFRTQERRMSFAQYDAAKSGDLGLTCESCGCPADLQFAPGVLGFSLKEGESGGWATKSIRENGYRSARSGVMAKRERDNVHKPKLVPNYKGQEAASWSEVRDHVRSTVGAESAATYDQLVKQEG
jgi:hypothetical protein